MLTPKPVIKFIVGLACAATLGSWSVAFAQQLPQQTPRQPPATRPPDPARIGPMPAAQFKAPDSIDFRTANVMSDGIYRESRDQAIKLAVEWFDQYLKK